MAQVDTQFKKGSIAWNKGISKTLNTGKTHFKKGVPSWNKGTKGVMKAWNKGKDKRLGSRCKICQKRFKVYEGQGVGKYCSNRCAGISREKNNNPNWIGGGLLYVRKIILVEQDYTCQVCGLRDPEIMEVNHKLERSKYPELASDRNNLEVLCPNCHRRKTNLFLRNRSKQII